MKKRERERHRGSRSTFGRTLGCAAALLLAAGPAFAPDAAAQESTGSPALTPLSLDPYSRLWLTGSSSVRDWRCDATRLVAEVAVGSRYRERPAGAREVEAVALDVPVGEIRCDVTPMEEDLYEALKGERHPAIQFRLDRFEAVPGAEVPGNVWVTGRLTVAGETREVSLKVDVTAGGHDVLRATGSKEIRMTDFGVEPPTAFLGLIKAHDRLTVHFDLSVSYEELARRLGVPSDTVASYAERWAEGR